MYQFMVATTRSGSSLISSTPGNPSSRFTTGGEISTMSITSGTNKWASRFVVALQLAAWSAVGIVLLEKGISSLQKSNAAKDEQKITSRSEDVLSVIPLMAAPMDVLDGDSRRPIVRKEDRGWSSEDSAVSRVNPGNSLPSGKTTEVPIGTSDPSADVDVSSVESSTQRALTNAPTNDEEIFGGVDERHHEADKSDVPPGGEETTGRIPDRSTENPEDSTSWSRKRLRFAHMNGNSGGAAAAVAMVTVGAVMLVLGPAVIVLRALDERRQERRFLKLSVEEDLPPSYEQATGSIEQAPTYSSLNLDTIATSNETPATSSASGLLR